ncbi:hypothetical protein GQ42DRAFT_162513 [Ramicandelaber brevisporus]|nr:hypothetical protein GQ42DRAFT_162513 [Ramicandelaber brevisporus]
MKLLKFDWLQFVKRTTYLSIYTSYEKTAEMIEMRMKLIKQFKMLQVLSLSFDKYDTPEMIGELAAAINGLKYLKHLTCGCSDRQSVKDEGGEWKRAASFVNLLHASVRSRLKMMMSLDKSIDETNVRTLAPYVVELMAYGNGFCIADLVHRFIGVRGKDGQPLVFPQLRKMEMSSCCFRGGNNGVNGIISSRLPQLQHLYFSTRPCHFGRVARPYRNEHETYNWKPEFSGYAHVIIPSQRWQCLTELTIGIVSSSILMDIVGCNPQLRQLRVGSQYSNVPVENDASRCNHDKFQLETILERLPHLVRFSIEGLNSRLVVNPTAIPKKRRYNINITIGCQMSIAPSAVVYILQMPQLTSLSFYECVFVDVDETIQLLQNSTATCGAKQFDWFPIEWNQELVLAMTNKMPRLERFKAPKCPKEHRAIFEAKCVLRG